MMNKFVKILRCSAVIFGMSTLTSCAAGSATAGYALKAREADCLSAKGEQRITERVKRELMLEWNDCGFVSPRRVQASCSSQ